MREPGSEQPRTGACLPLRTHSRPVPFDATGTNRNTAETVNTLDKAPLVVMLTTGTSARTDPVVRCGGKHRAFEVGSGGDEARSVLLHRTEPGDPSRADGELYPGRSAVRICKVGDT